MNTLRFWAPIMLSIPVTIVCGILALGAAGVGHGSSLLLAVLFPYSVAVGVLAESLGIREVSWFFIIALVLQFPLYGLIIAIAGQKKQLSWAVTILIAMHLFVAAYFVYDYFSSPPAGDTEYLSS